MKNWIVWTVVGVGVLIAGLCGAKVIVEHVETQKMLDGLEKEYRKKNLEKNHSEQDIYRLDEHRRKERNEKDKQAEELLTGNSKDLQIGDEEILSGVTAG